MPARNAHAPSLNASNYTVNASQAVKAAALTADAKTAATKTPARI